MYTSALEDVGINLGIQKYLKKYFDLFALKDDQEVERRELEERQQREKDEERQRLQDEADKAHGDTAEAREREQSAQNDLENLG